MSISRKGLYKTIVNEFERCYSWLGRQVAEEILSAMASFNLNVYGKVVPDNPLYGYRMRRHILLMWKQGWFKSTLTSRFKEILTIGRDSLARYDKKTGERSHKRRLYVTLTDTTAAAFMGSADEDKFIPPSFSVYPIIFVDEIGKYTVKGSDMLQTLLSALEDDEVTRNVIKFRRISQKERDIATKLFNVEWPIEDKSMFIAPSISVVIGCTYKPDFIEDEALQTRFNIITPERELDNKLIRHVFEHGSSFNISESVCERLYRTLLKRPIAMPRDRRLPKMILSDAAQMGNPRVASSLKTWAMSREWWGLVTTKRDVINRASSDNESQSDAKSSATDIVIDLITRRAYSPQEIANKTGFAKSHVYRILRGVTTEKKRGKDKVYRYRIQDQR